MRRISDNLLYGLCNKTAEPHQEGSSNYRRREEQEEIAVKIADSNISV
ncbi:MAG TPA: hypothetical protein VE308_01285 [Nitrososphaera sp.]|jgi:hypothetical protein|nr:hypothetical protein [Nitrososphaera sp.]